MCPYQNAAHRALLEQATTRIFIGPSIVIEVSWLDEWEWQKIALLNIKKACMLVSILC